MEKTFVVYYTYHVYIIYVFNQFNSDVIEYFWDQNRIKYKKKL